MDFFFFRDEAKSGRFSLLRSRGDINLCYHHHYRLQLWLSLHSNSLVLLLLLFMNIKKKMMEVTSKAIKIQFYIFSFAVLHNKCSVQCDRGVVDYYNEV